MRKEDLRTATDQNGNKVYFHKWIIKKEENGDDVSYALVEDIYGNLEEIHHRAITFRT